MAQPFSNGVLGPSLGNVGTIYGGFNPGAPFASPPPTVSMLERGLNLGTVVGEKQAGIIDSLSPQAQANLYSSAAQMNPVMNPAITVTSGYRPARAEVFSSHPTREAVDIRNRGLSPEQQADIVSGLRAGGFAQVGVVGPGQSRAFDPHVHANMPDVFADDYVSHGVPFSSQPRAIQNALTQEFAVPQAKPTATDLPSYSQAKAALPAPVAAGPVTAALDATPATPVEAAKQQAAAVEQSRTAVVEDAQANVAKEMQRSALGLGGVSPLDNFGPATAVQTRDVTAPASSASPAPLGAVEGPFGLGNLEVPGLAPQATPTVTNVSPQVSQAPPTVQAPQIQGQSTATGLSFVDSLAPAQQAAIEAMGLGPASAGFSYGYSPMGGVAAVHANAPDHVKAAATGPGLLGALGIGPMGQQAVARTALGIAGGLIGGPIGGVLGIPGGGFLGGLAARTLGNRASASISGRSSGSSGSGNRGSSGSAGIGGTGRGGAADRESAGSSNRG